jgi:Zn-dependent protease
MRDPISWKFPLARLFGIQIQVHVFFPLFALTLILREAYRDKDTYVPGAWIDAAIIVAIMFLSVLLHEFGHCFAARNVGGDANEVLLWPLGGLAFVGGLPHQPRAHFITVAGGPLVNLLLGTAALVALQFVHPPDVEGWLHPSFNPLYYTGRLGPGAGDKLGLVPMENWAGAVYYLSPYSMAVLLSWVFWVNYMQFLLNVFIFGWPLDGGRLLQSTLWPFYGYRQSMLVSVFIGFVFMFIVAVYGFARQEMMALGLALFMYVSCKHEWFVLETGGEESLFGYDFSQGYTSLERDMPQAAPTRQRRVGWWKRWQQERAAKRMKREEDTRISEERRMDELLEKVQREGISALTDEERRFMKRVSDRYKNRH